jgi:hypothetical protein
MYFTRYHCVASRTLRTQDNVSPVSTCTCQKQLPLLNMYQHVHLVHLALFSGEHIHAGRHPRSQKFVRAETAT